MSGGTWESGPKDPTEEGTSFIIFCQLECIPIGPRERLNYPLIAGPLMASGFIGEEASLQNAFDVVY